MAKSQTADALPENDNLKMTVKVEDVGPSRKMLKIEVPAEEVDDKLGASLDAVMEEVEMPGFRRGRAPKRLVEKKLGSSIRAEAKKQLVSAAYQQAVEQEKLKVIGQPTSETLDAVEIHEGKPITFEIEVEVQPEFDMPSLDGIKVRKPTFEVADSRIADEIKKIAINEGDLEERDNTEAGDYLTGHGIMTGPGDEEFYNIEGCVVRAPAKEDEGKGMILGLLVDDLGKQLGLPKAGEKATVKAKGPENHEREELRGKDVTITFTVSRIDRIIPSEVPDLIARYGMESEDQLREAIKTRLTQRGMVEQQSIMRSQVAKHLLDGAKMELPERLTADQAARSLERRRMELLYRGVDEQEIEKHVGEMRSSSAERAQRELKLFFILNQAAEDLDIKITEAEINGHIAQLAMQRGQRPEELRKQVIQSGQVQQIALQIREHKTMDAILAKAEVTEVSAAEFEKMQKEQTEAEKA